MNEYTVYIIGFIVVSLYIATGFDDFLWDIATIFNRFRLKSKNNQKLDFKDLNNKAPKLLAIVVAAWKEDNVLEDVIDNMIKSVIYPKSMYHIFLGVYPNDEATVQVAKNLQEKYKNVHVIINEKPGPTSKAQNINHTIEQVKIFESRLGWQFKSITIHDSEDVVHPYELLVTNYLLDYHKALQFPVFPIVEMPSFKNFFKNITTNTYLDEFSENHFNTMVSRSRTGAFVPSAGTGFAISREVIDMFTEKDILPANSLTEDYRFALSLYEMGIKTHYVLEKVPRILKENKFVWDYVATRSIFPGTYKTAIRQKTRWILGITMQSLNFKSILKINTLVGKYSLYRDWKAKVSNLLSVIGLPILVYFFLSLFLYIPVMFPMYSLSWWLSIVVTVCMIQRQIFRAIAIYNLYGWRSVFFSCLFPPLLPIRLIWGNIINFVATVRAYKQLVAPQKNQQKKNKKTIPWAKTEHTFLEKDVLDNYHRKIGDIFLKKEFISIEQLKKALSQKETPIGEYCLKHEWITEKQLLESLASLKQIQYFDEMTTLTDVSTLFDKELLLELLALPILQTETGYVVAFCGNSPENAQEILCNEYDIDIEYILMKQKDIENGINEVFSEIISNELSVQNISQKLHENGKINTDQLLTIVQYMIKNTISEEELLQEIGFLTF